MNAKAVVIVIMVMIGGTCIVIHCGDVDVTVEDSGYGDVICEKSYGKAVLTAVPDDDHVFAGWYDGDTAVSFDNPLTVNSDCVLSATYLPKTVTKTFAWTSEDGTQITAVVELDSSEYLVLKNDPDVPRRGEASDSMADMAVLDRSTACIAETLSEVASESDADELELAVRFVQGAIQYESDRQHHDGDYWKYPLETLWDSAGDCEDTSILLATILKAMGYDAVLVELPGHIGCAVSIPGADSNWMVDGVPYSYVETAVDGSYYSIGYLPGFEADDAVLINLSLREAGQ